MKASSVACCQVISNVSLNILYKIKPTIFMHGTEGICETAVTYDCTHSSQDWITERIATFFLVWNNRQVLEVLTTFPRIASL